MRDADSPRGPRRSPRPGWAARPCRRGPGGPGPGTRSRRGSGSGERSRYVVGGLRVRSDETVHVARLELVRVPRQRLEVADAELADAGGEDVAEGQCRERRVAAGAAALDREALRVDVAALDEEAGGGDAVVDVDDAPAALESPAVRPAVAGAPAVVDVDDRDAPAGQELRCPGRARWTRSTSGPPCERTTSGGRSPSGPREGGVRRRVVQRVGGSTAGRRERDRLGDRRSRPDPASIVVDRRRTPDGASVVGSKATTIVASAGEPASATIRSAPTRSAVELGEGRRRPRRRAARAGRG